MDPDAAAALMRDTTRPDAERYVAALDLCAWLNRGGFPQAIPDQTFTTDTAHRRAAVEEAHTYLDVLSARLV
jgi:hypothetical protein